MPIYEYECGKCHKVVEVWQSISDDPMASCPDCSGPMKKLISSTSFQLKGGGWFADSYNGKSNSGCATGSGCAAGDSGGCAAGSSSCGCG